MANTWNVREGMVVHSLDGERLGKVVAVGADHFQIEKGFFFPKEYFARMSDISSQDGDDVILAHGQDALRETATAEMDRSDSQRTSTEGIAKAGVGRRTRTAADLRTDGSASDSDFKDETLRIPPREEEVEIRKRPVLREEVRIHEDSRVEQRAVEDAVRHEEVTVDRGTRKTPKDTDRDLERRDPSVLDDENLRNS